MLGSLMPMATGFQHLHKRAPRAASPDPGSPEGGLPSIHAWQVVVITPSRQLNFGASEPAAEFLACRVQWVELLPERWRAGASKFHRLLALLVRPEAELQEAVSWAMTLLEPHRPRSAP